MLSDKELSSRANCFHTAHGSKGQRVTEENATDSLTFRSLLCPVSAPACHTTQCSVSHLALSHSVSLHLLCSHNERAIHVVPSPFLSFSLSSHPCNSHLLAIVTKPRHFMKSHNYPQKQMGRNLWSPPLCSLAAVISRMKSFVLQADGYSDWQRVSVNKQTVILLYSLYSPLSPRMILLQTKARMRTRG